jgi:hypothetical protein
VKRIRENKPPLTAVGLHALRDDYPRTIDPARALAAKRRKKAEQVPPGLNTWVREVKRIRGKNGTMFLSGTMFLALFAGGGRLFQFAPTVSAVVMMGYRPPKPVHQEPKVVSLSQPSKRFRPQLSPGRRT